VRRIYAQDGLKGFYRGITASYFGISETVIHFAIYETIKQKLAARHAVVLPEGSSDLDVWLHELFEPMLAGATSRLCASLVTYPHGEINLLIGTAAKAHYAPVRVFMSDDA